MTRRCLFLPLLVLIATDARAQEDYFAFIPDGGRTILAAALAAEPSLAGLLVPAQSAEDWLTRITGKGLPGLAGLDDWQARTLADYLAYAGSIDPAALPPGARIGTSAPRRAAQALHFRPDCQIVSFRGNVATRLGKLEAGEADATLLAAAGLERLGQSEVGVALDPQMWLPAPGKGCIAIECRSDDAGTAGLLAAIDHQPSRMALLAERALLAALGGNCHSPIAALTEHRGEELVLHAALFSPDGAERVAATLHFPAGDPAGPAELARLLLDQASPNIRQHFEG